MYSTGLQRPKSPRAMCAMLIRAGNDVTRRGIGLKLPLCGARSHCPSWEDTDMAKTIQHCMLRLTSGMQLLHQTKIFTCFSKHTLMPLNRISVYYIHVSCSKELSYHTEKSHLQCTQTYMCTCWQVLQKGLFTGPQVSQEDFENHTFKHLKLSNDWNQT